MARVLRTRENSIERISNKFIISIARGEKKSILAEEEKGEVVNSKEWYIAIYSVSCFGSRTGVREPRVRHLSSGGEEHEGCEGGKERQFIQKSAKSPITNHRALLLAPSQSAPSIHHAGCS